MYVCLSVGMYDFFRCLVSSFVSSLFRYLVISYVRDFTISLGI